jgi:hypothetical protein
VVEMNDVNYLGVASLHSEQLSVRKKQAILNAIVFCVLGGLAWLAGYFYLENQLPWYYYAAAIVLIYVISSTSMFRDLKNMTTAELSELVEVAQDNEPLLSCLKLSVERNGSLNVCDLKTIHREIYYRNVLLENSLKQDRENKSGKVDEYFDELKLMKSNQRVLLKIENILSKK